MDVRDRIIREAERKQICGNSPTSAWRGEQNGTFPKRVRISENAVGWRLSELMEWVESRQVCTPINTRPVAPGRKTVGRPRKYPHKAEG